MTAARGYRISPVSYRTTIVVAVVFLVAFFLATHANDQRESSLLQNETTQAAAVASSSFSNVTSVLDTLAKTTTISNASAQAFTVQAQALVHSPLSVALTKVFLDRYVVFAAVGNAFHVDQVLSVAAVTATRPGGAAVDTGQVVSEGDQSTATFAVGPPLVPRGNAIFLQFTVNPFTATSVAPSRAFSDLQVALYGSDHPARSNLVAATSSELGWPGPVANAPVQVGNTDWTLVASARSPLIGTFASSAPFLILILGLLLALFMGGAIEVFLRRHRFLPAGSHPPSPAPEATETPAVPPGPEEVKREAAEVSEEPPTAPQSPAPESATSTTTEDEETGGTAPTAPAFYADWRPDPYGHFELRRFFLGNPTSLVRDGATERYDPVPTDAPTEDASEPTPSEADEQTPPSPPAPTEVEPEDGAEPVDSLTPPHGGEDLGTLPPTEEQEALEIVAALVADRIVEELESLRTVAAAPTEVEPEGGAEPVDSLSTPAPSNGPQPHASRPASSEVSSDEPPDSPVPAEGEPEDDAEPVDSLSTPHDGEALGTPLPTEEQEALEIVAATVADTIGEELEGLRTVAAAPTEVEAEEATEPVDSSPALSNGPQPEPSNPASSEVDDDEPPDSPAPTEGDVEEPAEVETEDAAEPVDSPSPSHGGEDLGTPLPTEEQEALEIVAAPVADMIGEELEGLRTVASALNKYLPDAIEDGPPAQAPSPSPPQPPLPAPLQPPPPPGPARASAPPQSLATAPSTSPSTPQVPTRPAAPNVGGRSVHSGRQHDNAKTIATLGGVVGVASMLWRRLRKTQGDS